MRKRSIRSLTLLTLFTTACLGSVCVVSFIYAQSGQQPHVQTEKWKTLRDVAQERDAEVIANIETETEQSDLRALAKNSNAIVLGRITEAHSSFTDDGNFTFISDILREP